MEAYNRARQQYEHLRLHEFQRPILDRVAEQIARPHAHYRDPEANDMPPQMFLVVLGGVGAGKSTLANAMYYKDKPRGFEDCIMAVSERSGPASAFPNGVTLQSGFFTRGRGRANRQQISETEPWRPPAPLSTNQLEALQDRCLGKMFLAAPRSALA